MDIDLTKYDKAAANVQSSKKEFADGVYEGVIKSCFLGSQEWGDYVQWNLSVIENGESYPDVLFTNLSVDPKKMKFLVENLKNLDFELSDKLSDQLPQVLQHINDQKGIAVKLEYKTNVSKNGKSYQNKRIIGLA